MSPSSRLPTGLVGLLVPADQRRSQASCRSADPELFFPLSSSGPSMIQLAKAKTVRAGCLVSHECLAFALRTHQAHGVWGGLSEQERLRVTGSLHWEVAR